MQIPVSRRLFDLLTRTCVCLNFSSITPLFRGVSLPGDHMPGVPPVPIPNTAVKPRAANGSRTLGPARVGRCQVYGPVLRKKDRASFLPFPPHESRIPWKGKRQPRGYASQCYERVSFPYLSWRRPLVCVAGARPRTTTKMRASRSTRWVSWSIRRLCYITRSILAKSAW